MEFTIQLIQKGKTYREIQDLVKNKYGSSMSNSTLKQIHKKLDETNQKDKEIELLRKELQLFKKLYFDLVDRIEKYMDPVKKDQLLGNNVE